MPLGGLDANNWRELLGEAHRRHLTPTQQTVIAKVALGHNGCRDRAGEGVSQATVRGWLRAAGERVYDPLGVIWTHGLLGLWYGAGHDMCCCSRGVPVIAKTLAKTSRDHDETSIRRARAVARVPAR